VFFTVEEELGKLHFLWFKELLDESTYFKYLKYLSVEVTGTGLWCCDTVSDKREVKTNLLIDYAGPYEN